MNNPAVLIIGKDKFVIEYEGKRGKKIECGFRLGHGVSEYVINPRWGTITTSLRELEKADKQGYPFAELWDYNGQYLVVPH